MDRTRWILEKERELADSRRQSLIDQARHEKSQRAIESIYTAMSVYHSLAIAPCIMAAFMAPASQPEQESE